MKFSMGPGALVAAAFIGPGTVTACTIAGASFGFSLAWALVFATVATIILQSMSARLGVAGRVGLGEAMVSRTDNPALKWGAAGLVLAALAIGNAAYESGNIAGGALGLDALFSADGDGSGKAHVLIVAGIAAAALLYGKYKALERILIALVILMSLAFAASFVLVRPDFGALLGGLVPAVPENGLLSTIAIIGTTIVPYNLFLHAAAARDRWQGGADDLDAATSDTAISIGLGGLVSIFILATAASTIFASGVEVKNAADMAIALEPLAGSGARYFIGIGLFAAGLTSSITAPMATAYAVTEIIPGLGGERKPLMFRVIALTIVAIGLGVSLLGIRPTELITIAQVANGLLLPIIAIFLLVAMNNKSLLGTHVNGWAANLLGGGVVAITILLGARLILRVFGVWP